MQHWTSRKYAVTNIHRMQRRTLFRLGVGAALVLAAAGGGVSLFRPGVSMGRLTSAGRSVFAAVARAVLDGSLPADSKALPAVLNAHLERVSDAIAAFPAPTRAEISQLLALLAAPPGRVALAGLNQDWDHASIADIQRALQSMRTSTLELRQQAYHALRDLTNAAFYSNSDAWPLLGYPGPTPV